MTTESNKTDLFHNISNLFNLSGLKFPPLRTWRTGNTAQDELRQARFWTGVMAVMVTLISIMICVWSW